MDKLRERAIVDAFIRWGGISRLSLRDWDRERPDALIASGDQVIGVEVTAVSEATPRQHDAPQKWKAEAFRIVDAARQAFEARNQTPVVVRFEMNPTWAAPNRLQSSSLVTDLATIVERTLATPPAWPLDKEPYTLRDPHPEVSWAYISRSNCANHWQSSISGEVLGVTEADVRATVERKETELPAYRQVASRVWLLIDCDVSGQGIALDVPTHQLAITSDFDRVFCCGFGMWQWVEIPTTGSGAGRQANTQMEPTRAGS